MAEGYSIEVRNANGVLVGQTGANGMDSDLPAMSLVTAVFLFQDMFNQPGPVIDTTRENEIYRYEIGSLGDVPFVK